MDWWLEKTVQHPCKCGKGKLTEKIYSNEINEERESKFILDCDECEKNYEVREESKQLDDGSIEIVALYIAKNKC